MAERNATHGMVPADGDRERLPTMLERPLNTGRETAVAPAAD